MAQIGCRLHCLFQHSAIILGFDLYRALGRPKDLATPQFFLITQQVVPSATCCAITYFAVPWNFATHSCWIYDHEWVASHLKWKWSAIISQQTQTKTKQTVYILISQQLGHSGNWTGQSGNANSARAIGGGLFHIHQWQYIEVFNFRPTISIKHRLTSKLCLLRSNLSSRFFVTNEALNILQEFPDLNVPIFVDDLSKQSTDGVQLNKLNRTEFIRQLEDFRWVRKCCLLDLARSYVHCIFITEKFQLNMRQNASQNFPHAIKVATITCVT